MDAQQVNEAICREMAARMAADGRLSHIIANRFSVKPMTRWQRFKRWVRSIW